MHMLIAEMNPVFVTIVVAAIAVVLIGHIWIFRVLHGMRKLNVRMIDSLTEASIAIARLEQAVIASHPTTADMRSTASSVSRAMQRPGLDVNNLLADTPEVKATEDSAALRG
jgi:hypothetical protein